MKSVPGVFKIRAMPGSTLFVVIGAWVVLAVLTLVAYRFNRNRSRED